MTDQTITALLVEDDQRLATLTKQYMKRHDVFVTHVTDGDAGLRQALLHTFDVVLLDLMLPGCSGLEVCQKIRERKDVPIIMLTARGEEADRVLGLEIGADDYMPKPFSPRELLARIHAVVRRCRGQVGPSSRPISIGEIFLDPGSRTAKLGDSELDLTSYEYDILVALVSHAGRVLSRERLMDLAKGSAEESFDRSIDVHVSRLRKKLGDDPRNPRHIKTVRGMGYQFVTE